MNTISLKVALTEAMLRVGAVPLVVVAPVVEISIEANGDAAFREAVPVVVPEQHAGPARPIAEAAHDVAEPAVVSAVRPALLPQGPPQGGPPMTASAVGCATKASWASRRSQPGQQVHSHDLGFDAVDLWEDLISRQHRHSPTGLGFKDMFSVLSAKGR